MSFFFIFGEIKGDYLDFRTDVDTIHFLQQEGDSVSSQIQFADYVQELNNITGKVQQILTRFISRTPVNSFLSG